MAPFLVNSDLPLAVRLDLPPSAQFAFRFAYNDAWHAHYDDPMREELALRKAWDHVKSRFRKAGENWLPIEQPPCNGKDAPRMKGTINPNRGSNDPRGSLTLRRT